MWSFAILLWELVTREVPYADLSNMEIGMKVSLEGLRPTIPPGISPHICKLMKICMNEDPAKRPKFDMIVPILEKMQDKWKTSSALLYWTVELPEIVPQISLIWWCGAYQYCLKLYSTAAFNATVASASEMNSTAVTSFYIVFLGGGYVFFFFFLVSSSLSLIRWCCLCRSIIITVHLLNCNHLDWIQSFWLNSLWKSA